MNPSRLALFVLIPLTLSIVGTPPARVGAAVQASSSHGPFRVKSYFSMIPAGYPTGPKAGARRASDAG